MWNEISDNNSISEFMGAMCYFHDSCIKEIKYLSGAYINKDLSMHPINDKRVLKVIIQRQSDPFSCIEMVFEGLKFLNLRPVDEEYTCEILEASMLIKGGCIYWCDSENLNDIDSDNYSGTVICFERLKWRAVENCMGESELYISEK